MEFLRGLARWRAALARWRAPVIRTDKWGTVRPTVRRARPFAPAGVREVDDGRWLVTNVCVATPTVKDLNGEFGKPAKSIASSSGWLQWAVRELQILEFASGRFHSDHGADLWHHRCRRGTLMTSDQIRRAHEKAAEWAKAPQ